MSTKIFREPPRTSADILLLREWLPSLHIQLATAEMQLRAVLNSENPFTIREDIYQNLSGTLDSVYSLISKVMATRSLTSGAQTTTATTPDKLESDWIASEYPRAARQPVPASTKKTRKPAKPARTGVKSKARSRSVPDAKAKVWIRQRTKKLMREITSK